MPAGNVRPRASQAPEVTDAARRLLLRAGWHLTDHGNIDTGQRVGPCTRCLTPTVRYGALGQPFCPGCRHTPET